MKNIFKKALLILNIFIVTNSYGQAPPLIQWQKSLGGTNSDGAYSVKQTSDSGFIVAGYTNSNDVNVTGNHGVADYWIVKLDANGILQWQKSLGGFNNELFPYIEQTNDGGYIVAGTSSSNSGNVTGHHGNPNSSWDYWAVKLDNTGNMQWGKSYGGTDDEIAQAVQQTSDGGYVVAGMSYSVDGDVTGHHSDTLYADYWIVKIDASGNIQWQKSLGGTGEDRGESVQQTTDGGYVIAGYSASIDGDVTGHHGSDDFWIVKLSSAGTIIWQKSLGGNGQDQAYSIQQTVDGGYIIAGQTNNSSGDVTGCHGNSQDFWVVKTDNVGIIEWQKCLGGTNGEIAYSVVQTFDGAYLIGGFAYSNNGDITGHHGATTTLDYWVAKLNNSGVIQWEKSLGGTGADYLYSIQQTDELDYILAGISTSTDGDVTGNIGGNGDYWVVKLSGDINLINGELFVDANSNGTHDGGETVLSNKKIIEAGTGRFAFSTPNGSYSLAVVDTGNYSVSPINLNYYSATPSLQTAHFNSMLQTDSLNDFGFQPVGVVNDLVLHLTPSSLFRMGRYAYYLLNYENVGNTTLNPTIILFPDSIINYVSASVVANSVTSDSIVWNLGPVAPFYSGSIYVQVMVNSPLTLGTPIHSTARIEPIAGDANSADNYPAWVSIVVLSHDPNEILVDRDNILNSEISNLPFLNYVINFQNTGNDTAFDVVVRNHIDTTLLDISSLEFVASSNPVMLSYNQFGSKMIFTFNNILLPDSTTNEAGSHAFVRYKIKPKSTIGGGDTIKNSALIYFDINAPVPTNTALTPVLWPAGISDVKTNDRIKIFPNPTSDEINFSIPSDVKLISITGQIISEVKNKSSINVKELPAGMYFLVFTNSKNEVIQRSKIVKE